MSTLDAIVFVTLGGCAIFGFMRGFTQESLSLLAWVMAIMAVYLFLSPVSDLMAIWFGTSGGASFLSFVLLFVLTLWGGKMLARYIGRHSRASFLGAVDRVLGAGFGAIKGLIGLALLFLAFSLFYNMLFGIGAQRPLWLESARSYPLLNASSKAMSDLARYRSEQAAAAEKLQGDRLPRQ